MRNVIVALATWGGVGFCPGAPGTVGTAAAIPLFVVLSLLPHAIYLAILLVIALLACWVAGRAEKILDDKDSSVIVIDEVVGYLVAMALIPASWASVLVGFIVFRLFDIIKPPPIRFLEKSIPGGYGVVLDDAVAGVYAHVVVRIVLAVIAR